MRKKLGKLIFIGMLISANIYVSAEEISKELSQETVLETQDEIEDSVVSVTISATGDVSLGNTQTQGYDGTFRKEYDVQQNPGNFCFGANRNPKNKETMIFQQTFTYVNGELQVDDNVNKYSKNFGIRFDYEGKPIIE